MHLSAVTRAVRRERGSVLALVPAGLLVLVVMAAMAVDSAVAYLGQQQLHDALSAAANDAASSAVSAPAFYGRGVVTLDSAQVERDVCLSVLAQGDGSLHKLRLWVAIGGEDIRVVGQAIVDGVFGRALPGFGRRQVRSSADAAVASGGPGDTPVRSARAPVGPLVPLACAQPRYGAG